MGGRNNKLKDEKDLDQKNVRQAKKSSKRKPPTNQKNHLKNICVTGSFEPALISRFVIQHCKFDLPLTIATEMFLLSL